MSSDPLTDLGGDEFGRDALSSLVEGLRSGVSGTLVVRGGPGSGKSAMLAGALGVAGGLTVVRVAGVESESCLEYSGLFNLLRPVLDYLSEIPAAQADAIRGALSLGPAGPGDLLGIGVAALGLLNAAARRAAVLILVDDGHWLDPASLAVVGFVARRLGTDPVGVVVALRRPEGDRELSDLPELDADRLSGRGLRIVPPSPRSTSQRSSGVTCRVMGRFLVSVEGRPVRLPGLTGRLVAYLAIRGPATAEELVEVFWPDDDPEQSRARLRKVVWRVRRQCEELIDRHGDSLALQGNVVVDVDRFSVAAEHALRLADRDVPAGEAARDALRYYGGELLPTLRYEEWTDSAREAHRRRYLALLDLLTADAAARREPERAVAYLERAIASDPYDERRYLHGSEILLAIGRRGPALGLLDRARRMMEELGLPPSGALVQLAETLRDGAGILKN
jgi:DNA-binding SARP family transcriptional activator